MKNSSIHILPPVTENVPMVLSATFKALPEVDTLVCINHKQAHKIPFDTLEDAFKNHDIILSHAFVMPISKTGYDEKYYLQQGPLTSGFIAVKRSPNTLQFLRWWEEKLMSEQAYNEQIWLNHVPILFDKVKVLPFVPVAANREIHPRWYHLKLKLQAIIHKIDTYQPRWLEKMLGVK